MDINEIMNRAKAAQAQALESLHKAEEKSEALAASLSPEPDASPQNNAALEAEQPAANARRQVEIPGQPSSISQIRGGTGAFGGQFFPLRPPAVAIRAGMGYTETPRAAARGRRPGFLP